MIQFPHILQTLYQQFFWIIFFIYDYFYTNLFLFRNFPVIINYFFKSSFANFSRFTLSMIFTSFFLLKFPPYHFILFFHPGIFLLPYTSTFLYLL